MYRTSIIARHTFFEASSQPIYWLLAVFGATVIFIYGTGLGVGPIPFFTLGEDTVMFKAIGLDIILVLVLIATLFAASKSIYEEIEDRTMLTLMSKPVRRWEVLLGKYFGLIGAALVAVALMGAVLVLCTQYRIGPDNMLNTRTIDDRELKQLHDLQSMHSAGLYPQLLLAWLQIAALTAISVAISTRVSLIVNLPVVILIYLAGNLTRFLDTAVEGRDWYIKVIAYVTSIFLPFLQTFDLRERTIYSTIAVPGTRFVDDPQAASLGDIWLYTGYATVYGLCYIAFALAVGMLLFQNRELGGAEG
jgi:hypothetical protein